MKNTVSTTLPIGTHVSQQRTVNLSYKDKGELKAARLYRKYRTAEILQDCLENPGKYLEGE